MANINGLGGVGNTSSIYGNRNVISGLASGLDTESMIANSVLGFKTKISGLQNKQTILQWKQDSFRSITDKMIALTRKYTSYTSSTNLFSPSFFNRAAITTANGANANAVSASGKTGSNVQINSVTQLATAAKYAVGAGALTGGSTGSISAKEGVDLGKELELSQISGTMTINYGGGKSVDLNFSELETFGSVKELADAITEKLSKQKISNSEGKMIDASTLINVTVDGNKISFADKASTNSVYISGASQGMQDKLSITPGNEATSFTVSNTDALKKTDGTYGEYLAGKEMTFNLNGVTKKIKLPTYTKGSTTPDEAVEAVKAYVAELQKTVNTAFGSDKITVSNTSGDSSLKLKFEVGAKTGSTLSISSGVGEMLGMGGSEATSYLSTSATLGDMNILDDNWIIGTDKDGNQFYEFKLNDVLIGNFTKDTSLDSILLAINSNTEAGVSVSYSKMTNQFSFTAKETGAAGRVGFSDGLAQKIFGIVEGGSTTKEGDTITYKDRYGKIIATSVNGTDAEFAVKINGQDMPLKRASNVVDLDGLSVTLKETFSTGDAVTFTTKTNSDTVIDAIKSFVEDFNTLANEIHKTYTTKPERKANGSSYQPLTDEDKASMTESAVKAYEEKAKQGLLFADSDLSTLYNQLRTAIAGSGSDGAVLRSIGLTTTYANGETTLKLDEDKMRAALDKNPDQVKDIFTKTVEGGASSDGLMQKIKSTMDAYASTSIATPGVLVRKAGTKLSSLSLLRNSLQTNIDDLNTQIGRWQSKMSVRVDYYTRKFTALERMMSQMNSQSAALFDMSGGN